MEIDKLDEAIDSLRLIRDLCQQAALEDGILINRFKVYAISNVAENTLLKIDPTREDEWKCMLNWAVQVANELDLEQEEINAMQSIDNEKQKIQS